CIQTHKTCNTNQGYIPTRLLKLEPATGTFRLILRDEVEPGSRFAALSHCWGSRTWDPDLILNRKNFAGLQKQNPLERLPKTFREAFEVLQRLNLCYLWIDRFCIMQDSVEDWQTQASLMYEVYRNAFICISALGAADDATGCFFNRNIEIVKPSVVTLSLNGKIPAKSYLNDKETYRWQDRFASEPLARRAWVVQERLLAPRTLHFGSSQIYWECHEEICCETDPDYDWWKVAHYGDSSKIRSSWKSLIGMKRLYAKDPVFALTEDWGNIARVYGGCQLTNSRDKLVAISAIAKDMKQRLQSLGEPARYLAGIWGQWLPRSLLW
ncbi:HET-domain-containing protein, partial [Colletotrichum zoysiae]